MKLKASVTIELAYIMPIIFLAFTAVLYLSFFFHDKNVLQGIVYEGVVIASSNYRVSGEVDEEITDTFINEKAETRLIYFAVSSIDIQVEEDGVVIEVQANKNGMELNVSKTLSLLEPETEIRTSLLVEDEVEEVIENLQEE